MRSLLRSAQAVWARSIVSLVLRTFEPRLRKSAAWPDLLKKVDLA
jgi:hypothetical protein